MDKLTRVIGSLIAGTVASVAVGVGVTEALAPYVWPSAMLGLPAGIVAGVAAAALGFLWLTARTERARVGRASSRTTSRLWATGAAVLAFVLVGGAATFVLAAGSVGVATALLTGGLPIGLVAAALAGYLTSRRIRTRNPPGEPTPR